MADDQAQMEEKLKNMSPQELQEYQKQNCIFCMLGSGKIPSKKVYEDEKVFAILDKNPAAAGHILLLPKEHYSIMPQVPQDVLDHLFRACQALSRTLLKAFSVEGTSILVANGLAAGQRAQHFMVHIIPRKENDSVGLKIAQTQVPEGILQQVDARLSPRIREVLGFQKRRLAQSQDASAARQDSHEHGDKEGADEDSSAVAGTAGHAVHTRIAPIPPPLNEDDQDIELQHGKDEQADGVSEDSLLDVVGSLVSRGMAHAPSEPTQDEPQDSHDDSVESDESVDDDAHGSDGTIDADDADSAEAGNTKSRDGDDGRDATDGEEQHHEDAQEEEDSSLDSIARLVKGWRR